MHWYQLHAMEQGTLRSRCWILRSQLGFTLIELILVIVVLGVLAVFAAPRMFSSSDFRARGFHDETLSLLRYAQKTAIAQRRSVCVALNPTGPTLAIDSNPVPDGVCETVLSPLNPPRGGSGLSASVAAFQFLASGGSNQSAVISISIANANAISVEASTGYVHD